MQAVYNVNSRPKDYYTLDRAKNGARGEGKHEYPYPKGINKGDSVIVGLGANDALAKASPKDFADALEKRVEWIQKKGGDVTLVGVEFDKDHPLYNRATQYNNAISNVAFKTGAKFLDVSKMNLAHKADNIHFKNSEYTKIMGAALKAKTPSREIGITPEKAPPTLAEQQLAGLAKLENGIPNPMGSMRPPAEPLKTIDDEPVTIVGQNPRLPKSSPFTEPMKTIDESSIEIKFKRGDSVSKYAMANGIKGKEDLQKYFKKFAEVNGIEDAGKVSAGRTYKMPSYSFQQGIDKNFKPKINTKIGGSDAPGKTIDTDILTVKSGDTLTAMVKGHFGIQGLPAYKKALEIGKQNGINPNKIEPGQKIDMTPDTPSPTMH